MRTSPAPKSAFMNRAPRRSRAQYADGRPTRSQRRGVTDQCRCPPRCGHRRARQRNAATPPNRRKLTWGYRLSRQATENEHQRFEPRVKATKHQPRANLSPLPEPSHGLLNRVVVDAKVAADRGDRDALVLHGSGHSRDPLVHRGQRRIAQLNLERVRRQGSQSLRARPPALNTLLTTTCKVSTFTAAGSTPTPSADDRRCPTGTGSPTTTNREAPTGRRRNRPAEVAVRTESESGNTAAEGPPRGREADRRQRDRVGAR